MDPTTKTRVRPPHIQVNSTILKTEAWHRNVTILGEGASLTSTSLQTLACATSHLDHSQLSPTARCSRKPLPGCKLCPRPPPPPVRPICRAPSRGRSPLVTRVLVTVVWDSVGWL